MNKKFGKVNEDKSITYAPDAVKIITTHTYEYDDYEEYDEEGNPIGDPVHHEESYDTEKKIFPPSAEDYKNAYNGPWLPNEFNEPTPTEGKEVDSEIWTSDGTKNIQSYTYKDIVKKPRIFSKLKLEYTLFQMGLLSIIDEFIDTQTITNEFNQTMKVRRAYETANEFSENHPLFAQYLQLAKEYVNKDEVKITDEQLETLLNNCIAD